jgi:hypothetical protein
MWKDPADEEITKRGLPIEAYSSTINGYRAWRISRYKNDVVFVMHEYFSPCPRFI